MKKTAESTFSFIIHERLKKEFNDYEDEISPVRAKKIIISALSLLPDLIIEDSKNPDAVIVHSIRSHGAGIEVHLQNAIDSVLILWNESVLYKDAS